MEKVRTFEKCKIARAIDEITVLVDGPKELSEMMDGSFFEDNCMEESLKTLLQNPGFYIADVEVWYEQGYDSDGYPHPGESDIDFRLTNVNEYNTGISATPEPPCK